MPDGNRSICRRCPEFADIVGGTPRCEEGVCVIEAKRDDIEPEILGIRSRSPLLVPVHFSIEAPDTRGDTLNLAEATLRQDEVERVIDVLRQNGILVVSVHNDWLFERPRLISLHWQAVSPPDQFLRASRDALQAAGVRIRPEQPLDEDRQ